MAAWIERNQGHDAELHSQLLEVGLPHDLSASIRVAQWAYEQTERANGQVWLKKAVFQHLRPDWRRLMVV